MIALCYEVKMIWIILDNDVFEMLKFKEITREGEIAKIGANRRVNPPFWGMYSIIDNFYLSNNFMELFFYW